MGDLLFSVIIPTCDRPEYLAQAVGCALGQSLPPLEVLLADNGTLPAHLPEAWRGKVSVLQLPPRCGVSRARNAGASAARGDHLAFLDDDDLWEQGYLEKAALALERTEADLLVARLDKSCDGEIRPWKNAAGRLDLATLLVENPGIVGSSTIVRRKAFLECGGYDEALAVSEDKALAIVMLRRGLRVLAAPEIQAIQREHQGPRLTDSGRMAEGLEAWIARFEDIMTTAQRMNNREKLWAYRWRTGGGLGNLLTWCYYSLVRKVFGG